MAIDTHTTTSADYSAVLARFRACILTFHFVRRIAAFTLSFVARLNLPVPLATFETVAVETPAAAATSFIVTGPAFVMFALFALTREGLHSSRVDQNRRTFIRCQQSELRLPVERFKQKESFKCLDDSVRVISL